jgi:glycosyltransferase involved in cell wall biosynthesis
MRICIVYDCLYPWTVGGAERWYRNLAERLSSAGHEITYLTRHQWDIGEEPRIQGVRVVAVSERTDLYTRRGRRRVWPPLAFGCGVFGHLARHGRNYDVVHTASFPYFPLLAAGVLQAQGRYRLVVDWHELWTRAYWDDYLGRAKGSVGWIVQRACLRFRQQAFCFSRLHEQRLLEQGLRGELTRLTGQYTGDVATGRLAEAEPVVVFAGRHIPEKRVDAVVAAVARAREVIPELRAEIYGDGPDRGRVLRSIAELRLDEHVSAPGFVDRDRLDAAIARSLCLVLPSRREGYGLVVVEAAAAGVPSVVVPGPDNAAAELVGESVNGALAPSASPDDLAAAIVRVQRAGSSLRQSTAEWFDRHSSELSLDRSLDAVLDAYGH